MAGWIASLSCLARSFAENTGPRSRGSQGLMFLNDIAGLIQTSVHGPCQPLLRMMQSCDLKVAKDIIHTKRSINRRFVTQAFTHVCRDRGRFNI